MSDVQTDPLKCDGLRLGQRRASMDDMGYFDTYPAAMYEAMASLSPSSVINSTTPHYGPLLYTLGRAIGVHKVLEIGVAQGWSSGFMAWAVKENNARYGAGGRYYGLDVAEKGELQAHCNALDLPATFIAHPKGSVDWLETQKLIEPETLDLVFVDGWHNNVYVKREIELLYPLVKGNGKGYIAMHDIYAYVEGAWKDIVQDTRYQWEHVRFLDNYGFGLLRKMEGYDPAKVYWPDGDQPHAENFSP